MAAALVRGPFLLGEAVAVMRAVEAYVLGSALGIVAPDTLLNRDSLPEKLAELHANLDPRDVESWSAGAAFDLGLNALLDGLVATLECNGVRVARLPVAGRKKWIGSAPARPHGRRGNAANPV